MLLLAGKYDGRTRLDRGGTCNFCSVGSWRALLGSYLFGGIDALGFHLQVVGLPVSVFILNMLPYIFTIVVLILVLARKGGPSGSAQALGQPYDREER